MCGPKYCPMHNFREVDWGRLERLGAADQVPRGRDRVGDDS
jgi:phosphomethylpyrimidine synthase